MLIAWHPFTGRSRRSRKRCRSFWICRETGSAGASSMNEQSTNRESRNWCMTRATHSGGTPFIAGHQQQILRWYPRSDSNRHDLRRRILNPLRLPFRHSGLSIRVKCRATICKAPDQYCVRRRRGALRPPNPPQDIYMRRSAGGTYARPSFSRRASRRRAKSSPA